MCNQCKQALIHIDKYGEQANRLLDGNRWYTAEGKRKKLSEEDSAHKVVQQLQRGGMRE